VIRSGILSVFIEEFVRSGKRYCPFRFLATFDKMCCQYIGVEGFLRIEGKKVAKQMYGIQFDQ